MSAKDIAVGEGTFRCPLTGTVDQAKVEIRSRFLFIGGGLEDANGALVDGNAKIGDTNGEVKFVEGQPAQQGRSYSTPYLFNYTAPM
jgi:hypothetical protein